MGKADISGYSNKSLSIRLMRLNNAAKFDDPNYDILCDEVIRRVNIIDPKLEDLPIFILCKILVRMPKRI